MAYVSSSSLSGASATSAAIPVPGSSAAGLVAVVGLYMESTAAVTAPAEFGAAKADLQTSAASRGRLVVYSKKLTAADAGTYTFTWSGATFRAGVCAFFSGRASDQFDGTPGTAESVAAVTTLNVSTSPAAANGDAVGFWTNFNGGGGFTQPTNYTERQDVIVITVDTRDAVVAGSTGSVTATHSISDFMKAFLGVLAEDTGTAGPPVQNNPLTPFPVLQRVVRQASLWRPVVYGEELAVAGTNAPAESATANGVANDATIQVATGPSSATGTGTAHDTTSQVKPGAQSAAAAGVANSTTSTVAPTPATATATGAAQAPSPSIRVNADVAAATGTAFNATVSTGSITSAPAGHAAGTGTANNASAAVAPTPATATATGAAQGATGKVSPTPTTATATGTANNATVTTGATTNALAGVATATGTANGATTRVAPTPQTAVAVGTVSAASLSVRASAQAAAALGVANTPTISGLVFTPGTAHAATMTTPTGVPGSAGVPVGVSATGTAPTALAAAGTASTGNAAASTVPTATGG
jgi:hypothetical protein